jgi:ribosome-binding protein aMBF1 (putative translation factor)
MVKVQTISIANDELVVLSRKDFDRLMEKAGMLPARPRGDAHGTVPAREAIDVSIARDLASERIRRGWTQTELARRSGVRLETISRIESGKHIPRQETLLKLDRALAQPGLGALKGALASKKGKGMSFAQIRKAAAKAATLREGRHE